MVTGFKEQQHVTRARQRPDWPFLYLCLETLNLNLPAKFDVFSFIVTKYNTVSQNSKVGHLT